MLFPHHSRPPPRPQSPHPPARVRQPCRDCNKITAKLEAGVLRLTIPKKDGVSAEGVKRIEVQ